MEVWCGLVDYGDVFTVVLISLHYDMYQDPLDSLSEQSSSVHGDDAVPLSYGFNFSHDDLQGEMHNASQPAFTLPSMYSKIPVGAAPVHTAQSTSPASNMVAPGSILLQEKKTLTIKVNEQDIYNGDENTLYMMYFFDGNLSCLAMVYNMRRRLLLATTVW